MSFILDALKKSENQRQQQGVNDFSAIPVSAGNARTPNWLWIVIALLLVNALVLGTMLLRDNTLQAPAQTVVAAPRPAPTSTAPAESAINTSPPEPAGFAEQVAVAKSQQPSTVSQPAADSSHAVAAATEQSVPAARSSIVKPTSPEVSQSYVPTFDEVRLDSQIQMTDLHLDIHVYGPTPAERFVFINMSKHRENSRLAEGPTVREIRPDGVILEYNGTVFLLPRE